MSVHSFSSWEEGSTLKIIHRCPLGAEMGQCNNSTPDALILPYQECGLTASFCQTCNLANHQYMVICYSSLSNVSSSSSMWWKPLPKISISCIMRKARTADTMGTRSPHHHIPWNQQLHRHVWSGETEYKRRLGNWWKNAVEVWR